jgi:hypothetical protein
MRIRWGAAVAVAALTTVAACGTAALTDRRPRATPPARPPHPSADAAAPAGDAGVADVLSALVVAGRLAVRIASGPAPPSAVLLEAATPTLAAALGGPGPWSPPPVTAVVLAETVDDLGPGRVGVTVAVAIGSRVRVLDELVVETAVGWRVAEVVL